MKKLIEYLKILLVLTVATVFFTCSVEETTTNLSPPGWIIGVWSDGVSGDLAIKYEFTADDVKSRSLGATLSFKEIFSGGDATDSVGTSPQSYTIVAKGGSLKSIYYFEYDTGTTIKYWIEQNPLSDTIDKSKAVAPEGITLTKQ